MLLLMILENSMKIIIIIIIIPVQIEEDHTERQEFAEEVETIDAKIDEEEATQIDEEEEESFVCEIAHELNGEVDPKECTPDVCEEEINPVQIEEDHIESKKIAEEVETIDEEGTQIDDEDEERFVSEVAHELNGEKVDPKKCTPDVCENVSKRKQRVARKLLSSKTRRQRRGEQIEETIPRNGVKIPTREKKGGGIFKIRGRYIAENKRCKHGDDDVQGLQEDLDQCKNQYEIQELQQANDLNLRAENEEEGGEDDKKVKGNGRKSKGKEVGEGTPIVCENGAEKDGDQGASERVKRSTTGASSVAKKQKMYNVYDDNGIKVDSAMCHQCQRNDKGRVVRCTNCKTKRFCIPCIVNWYSRMTEEQIAQSCPVCLGNCNCKSCLRMDVMIKNLKTDKEWKEFLKAGKVEHSKILLKTVLPFLKQLNEEQIKEKEAEAKIQGMLVSEVHPEKSTCSRNEHVFWSCPECTYDLCLSCCCEIRAGNLQSCEEIVMKFLLHGGKEEKSGGKNGHMQPGRLDRANCNCDHRRTKLKERSCLACLRNSDGKSKKKPEWKADEKGNTPCPPSEYGGCGEAVLILNSFLLDGHISSLLEQAEQIVAKWKQEDLPKEPNQCSSDIAMDADSGTHMRKCASRESSKDNYIYCPDAMVIQHTDLQRFQQHWARGEPVIVRNALQTSLGLSWEPMVIWHAFRQIKNIKHSTLSNVKALDCLDWCEVDVNLHKFFEGYLNGKFDLYNWPVILKLKDRPDTSEFEKQLPRHSAEFISALPFKEYTHPWYGTLNQLPNGL